MKLAAVCIFLLGAYYQLTQWADLFPWNNIRDGGQPVLLIAVIGVLSVVLAVILWLGWKEGAFAAVMGLGVWGWFEFQQWWAPWFGGATPEWTRQYEARFADTVHWIGASEGSPSPDANHIVLHVLIAVALFASLSGLVARRSI
ncbi:MAG: hypothetical protein R3C52_03345 [Hyphomonadaceae bacterium]